jgi:DUF971 family protein
MSAGSIERTPTEINASKNSPIVEIVWDDGHRSPYQVSFLRSLCPCATCREAAGGSPHEPLGGKKPGQKPLGAAPPAKKRSLPMFKAEKFQIVDMHYVGNYALGISWLDKHQSIFPWSMLSGECPCTSCQAEREKESSSE